MSLTRTPEDRDVLTELIRRSPLLEELRRDALDRAELQERLGVSRSTSHRYTRRLGDLGVIEKEDGRFRLTASGELLADALARFDREARSALGIAPVLEAVRDAPVGVDVDAFAGARVTSAERGDPYSPLARFVALVRESETLCGFDVDVIAPVYIDEIQRHIVDGMETETIALPEVARDALADYPEKCMDACASGNLTIQLYDDLPFGVAILDDRVAVGVRERDARRLSLLADTDAPAVREWAEALYDAYDSEAVPLTEFTHGGFREATETLARRG